MKKKINRSLWLRFDRTLSQDTLRQVVILIIALGIAFVLSVLLLSLFGGNLDGYYGKQHISYWTLPLYLLIDGNAFSNLYTSGAVNGGAVVTACVIYIVGVVIFTGMLIAVISNIVERRVEDYKKGHIHYLKAGHYIIMGYDDMVSSFINHIFAKDSNAYILILSSTDATKIKESLSRLFKKDLMKRIIVNYGYRTSIESFKGIHLESAEQVYIVGHHSNSAHDAINVESVDCIRKYLSESAIKDYPQRITCTFKDLDTYAAFKTSEIFSWFSDKNIEFVPYNFFSGWAKQVFVKCSYHDMENPDKEHQYPTVYGDGITEEDKKYVHLVFVGTTNFAVAFAMEAANVLHFPNFIKNKELRTRITFIDKNADKEKDEFITRNRHFFEVQSYYYDDLTNVEKEKKEPLEKRNEYVMFEGENSNFLDVEFEFIKGDVFSKQVQDKISGWAGEHNNKQYLSIFLALSNQRENFVMGMNMPDSVYTNKVNVFIRQDRSDNFVTNLRMADSTKEFTYAKIDDGKIHTFKRMARYANIYPFGMNEAGYSEDDRSLKRAKLINYLYSTMPSDNKFQSILELDAMSEEQIWLEANEKWRDLTVALKWSNLYNAYTIRTKLVCLRAMRGLKVDDKSRDIETLSDYEVDVLAKVEHNRWNVEKLLMGFRKPNSDEDKYEHSDMAEDLQVNKKLFIHHDIRPFEKLGDIKELDKEFSRYIPWIMKMTEK